MKRIGAIACLVVFMMTMTMGIAMGASELKVEKISPKDKATDMAMDNMGFKVYFNQDVYEKQKDNKKFCSIKDSKGKEVPSLVVSSKKEKKVMMVLADTTNKDIKIKGKTKYTLTIEEGFKSDSGGSLAEKYESSFTTLNPSSSMWISMGMMGVMVIGMVFFSSREAKRQKEKETPEKKHKAVNPYKEAKRTGKSVEEIVAAEEKKKAKREAKRERQKKENKVEIASDNIRVKRKAPISAVGIKYKDPAPKEKPKAQSQSNKNHSGKNHQNKNHNKNHKKKKK